VPVSGSNKVGKSVREAQVKPLGICSQLAGQGYRQPSREELTLTSALAAWAGPPALRHDGHCVTNQSRNRLLGRRVALATGTCQHGAPELDVNPGLHPGPAPVARAWAWAWQLAAFEAMNATNKPAANGHIGHGAERPAPW